MFFLHLGNCLCPDLTDLRISKKIRVQSDFSYPNTLGPRGVQMTENVQIMLNSIEKYIA